MLIRPQPNRLPILAIIANYPKTSQWILWRLHHFQFSRCKQRPAYDLLLSKTKSSQCNPMPSSGQLTRRQSIWALSTLGALGSLMASGFRAHTNEAAAGVNSKWLTLPPTPTLPHTTRKGFVTVDGVDLFYAQFGQGPPILLLHGGLANSNYWGHQIEHLADRFSVIVMDTRGHGRSPVMSRAFSYRLFAEDAAGLLDFLKIPQVSVVGWSDGAVTGLALAMTKPERVGKLFAFGANSSADGLKPNGAKSPVFTKFASRCRAEYALLSPHPERWQQLLDGLRVHVARRTTLHQARFGGGAGRNDDFRRRVRRNYQTRSQRENGTGDTTRPSRNAAGRQSFRNASGSRPIQSGLDRLSCGVARERCSFEGRAWCFPRPLAHLDQVVRTRTSINSRLR